MIERIHNWLSNPREAWIGMRRRIGHVKGVYPHDFGIQGSYFSGNIGDRAIGEALRRALRNKNHSAFLFGKEKKQSRCTVRVLGGGGVLHDWYGTEHLKNRLSYVKDGGVILGVGVPGFRSDGSKKLINNILPGVKKITVRDRLSKLSLEETCDIDVSVTACPAFLHKDPKSKSNNYTGVNFRPWFELDGSILNYYFNYSEGIDPIKAKNKYISNIKRVCEKVDNPVFIPFTLEDEIFAKKYLDIRVMSYQFSVSETLKRVSGSQKMVCTRYHSVVFSAICRKPILAIAYAPKVSSLSKRLGIPSYMPNKSKIPVRFDKPKNVGSIKSDASRNIDILLGLAKGK